MLSFSFKNTPEEAAKALQAKGPAIVQAIILKLNTLMVRLQSHIVLDKLSGQVLHRRSGKLAQSVRVIPVQQEGTLLVGRVQGAGGPAFYGRFHEFGTDRPYEILPKNKRALRLLIDGKEIFARRVMHPPIQKRSFMISSLEDMRVQMIAELQETIREAGK